MSITKIAVMGYGVVGSGTVELFYKNKESICKKADKELDIKYILDLRDFPGDPFEDKLTKDFNDILNDDEVQIVAELMGGKTFAYEYTKQLLSKGKSVVTSNKELVAAHGAELLAIAKKNKCNYLFEASVGGGIPIIRPLHQCLAGNKIEKIAGILNGTTNFILTKMIYDQLSFDEALKLAQQLGYAEKDPTADIEGYDACRKICILGSLAFGKHIYPEYVHCSGITRVTLDDVEYADNAGYAIKLIGSVEAEGDKLNAMVCPRLVSKNNMLASVNDVYNAISVTGDGVGEVLFYGRGAGKLATASAVVGDIVDAAKHIGRPIVSLAWEDSSSRDFIIRYKESAVSMYVRITADEVDSYKEEISEMFGYVDFIPRKRRCEKELAFITPKLAEFEIDKRLEQISKKCKIESKIRVL